MSSNTQNLNLLKMDPSTDGDSTFNIKTMLNDNWDKVDEAVSGREMLLKNKAIKNAPEDDDRIPVIESGGTVKISLWSQAKTSLRTYFETLFAAKTHKSAHATGGTDALSPFDIGALEVSGDGKDVTVTFTAADTKINIASGDKLSVFAGKLSKWFTSFGTAAWLNVGTVANTVAAGDHGHTKNHISDFPTTMTPTVHKDSHKTGGVDAIIPSDIGAAIPYSGTATLAVANWAGSTAPYTYTVTVAGMLDTDNPQIGVVLSHTDISADDLLQKEWGKAVGNGAKATAGKITLYAKEKPTVAIPMFWRGSR